MATVSNWKMKPVKVAVNSNTCPVGKMLLLSSFPFAAVSGGQQFSDTRELETLIHSNFPILMSELQLCTSEHISN